jgi:hypothetical protein
MIEGASQEGDRSSDLRERIRSAHKRFLADVRITLAHGGAFVANQGLHNGVRIPASLRKETAVWRNE